jgi:hypothetical protein
MIQKYATSGVNNAFKSFIISATGHETYCQCILDLLHGSNALAYFAAKKVLLVSSQLLRSVLWRGSEMVPHQRIQNILENGK